MARTDFGDHEGMLAPEAEPGAFRLRFVLRLVGGLTSLALVAYLAHWGWDLAMLDVRGVPVIHAPEGPMRIQPEETGGEVISNQGLAVNAIAAGAGAALAADEVFLAPPPVTLLPDDTPGLPAQAPEAADGDAFTDPTAEAVASAIAEAIATPDEDAAATGVDVGPARAPPRPEGLALARSAAPSEVAPDPVDPESVAPGTRLVQFGAYDSPDQAQAEWLRLAADFPALMADKAMVIQPAESGGRAFWRLRALGFADEAEARRFCAAIDAGEIHCIPVVQR